MRYILGEVRAYKVKVTTAGVAGSATGENNSQPFAGKILAVDMFPHASAPATQDVVVYITKDDNNAVNLETIATFTNTGATAARRVPKKLATQHDGSALADSAANVYDHFVTYKGIHIEVAESNALTDAVEIVVTVEG
jgi:hypothetical protein